MKRLLLVAMNAESKKKAIVGFRGAIWKEVDSSSGILTDKSIKKMLAKVRIVHSPIAECIHSGAGKMLQNLDSEITEAILLKMMKAGIPCFPFMTVISFQRGTQRALNKLWWKSMSRG